MADDVGGSEIRTARGSEPIDRQRANTRSDALSGFDHASEPGEPCGSEAAEEPQMTCRVSSEGGIEWTLLDAAAEHGEPWSPPTLALLKVHDTQEQRRRSL